MDFRVDYKNVATYLSRQLAENQSTVCRLKNEIHNLKQNHEYFLEDAKNKIGECRALDLETNGILLTIKNLWQQMNGVGEEEAVAGRCRSFARSMESATVSTSCPSAEDRRDVRPRLNESAVVLDGSSPVSDLTSYLNSMCGKRGSSAATTTATTGGSRVGVSGGSTNAESDDAETGASVTAAEDPFERLLQENELLANDLKTKKQTIEVLAQKLAVAECERGPSNCETVTAKECPPRPCPCKAASGDESPATTQAGTAKVKKKIRFLLAKLESKLRENQALVQKIENCKGTDQEYSRLVDENRHLKERLKSSLRHRNSLESEIQRGYQIIKRHEEEKVRMQQKIDEIQMSLRASKSAASSPAPRETPSSSCPKSRSLSTSSMPSAPNNIWCNDVESFDMQS